VTAGELRTLLADYPDDAVVVVVYHEAESEDVTVERDENDGLVYCVIDGS
jgi:hypothetical protein